MLTPDGPNEYGVWSFAVGCDISSGDSGGALIDKTTGRFAGLIWSGLKDKQGTNIYDDGYLEKILKSEVEDEELVWSQMNYGVPAPKIIEVIKKSLPYQTFEDQETLMSVLGMEFQPILAWRD